MKKLLLLLLGLFLSHNMMAQLEVKEGSFKEVKGFVNINPDQNYQTDDNDLPFAVIKVRTENITDKQRRELKFNGNAGTFIMLEYKDGEVWVYLTAQYASYLKISHHDFSSVEFTLPFDLTPKQGYEMTLVNKSPKLDKNNYLIIKVDQTDAKIYIDDEFIGTGYASKVVSIGEEHTYKVNCEDYYPKEGLVYFDKREDKEINIVLEPDFGYITIMSDPIGADVYIDEIKVGNTPYNVKKIKLGQHSIELRKYGYVSVADIIIIKTGDHNKQFANVKLKEVSNAKENTNTKIDFSHEFENKSFTIDGVAFEMIAVKGGSFIMGCTWEQIDCNDREIPTHSVTLDDYYIGKHEVTVELFRAFISETGYITDAEKKGETYVCKKVAGEWDRTLIKGVNWQCDNYGQVRNSSEGNHPVIHVSWNDAKAFCDWLTRKTGQTFRLPTESEWEYAARGGNKSRKYIYSGSDILDNVGWFWQNSGDKYLNGLDDNWDYQLLLDNNSKTHSVGMKNPNELGIYDMSGNVSEWCWDKYDKYSNISQNNPIGPYSGYFRVLRGGNWTSKSVCHRVSYRGLDSQDNSDYETGFRLALNP